MNHATLDCPKCDTRATPSTALPVMGWTPGIPVFTPMYCDGYHRVSGACMGKYVDAGRPAGPDQVKPSREHLHYRCRVCGFEILGPCADDTSGT